MYRSVDLFNPFLHFIFATNYYRFVIYEDNHCVSLDNHLFITTRGFLLCWVCLKLALILNEFTEKLYLDLLQCSITRLSLCMILLSRLYETHFIFSWKSTDWQNHSTHSFYFFGFSPFFSSLCTTIKITVWTDFPSISEICIKYDKWKTVENWNAFSSEKQLLSTSFKERTLE